MALTNRTLFTGDNLFVLRGMNSDSVDLIYLDPPFNSNATYSAPIGSEAAGAAFKDSWSLDDVDAEWHGQIADEHPGLYKIIDAAGAAHSKGMQAYLIMMAIRLIEMRRILKPTGSIYLHCDPTASHYLKATMDAVFGREQYLSDITWKRYAPHSLARGAVDCISDQILYYANDAKRVLAHTVTAQLAPDEMRKRFPHVEQETGRRYQHVALEQSANRSSAGEARVINGESVTSELGWRWSQKTFDDRLAANPHLIHWTGTGRPRYKKYADDYAGRPVGNIWTDIQYLSSGDRERTGFPTQKPLALLERIIRASSNEGDFVFDPFCGCATTLVAAERLSRKWGGGPTYPNWPSSSSSSGSGASWAAYSSMSTTAPTSPSAQTKGSSPRPAATPIGCTVSRRVCARLAGRISRSASWKSTTGYQGPRVEATNTAICRCCALAATRERVPERTRSCLLGCGGTESSNSEHSYSLGCRFM